MLNEGMIRLIKAYTVGCVATARPDGAPAVSPKATFLVLNKQQIAFSHIRSPGTVENLLRRPNIEVNFVDLFAREGCRVRGIAEDSVASLCGPSGQVQAVAWQGSDESHRCGRIRPSKGGNSPLR